MAAKLQCEICGGKLIGKPGGIFECENCGTEYSTEWAKAKIQEITGTVKVEGTVEVTGKVQVEGGTVQVDSSVSKEALLQRGNFALEDGDWAKAKELFDQVLNIDPCNADAYLGLALADTKFRNRDSFQHLFTRPNCPIRPKFRLNKNAMRAKQFGGEELLKWFDKLDSEASENDRVFNEEAKKNAAKKAERAIQEAEEKRITDEKTYKAAVENTLCERERVAPCQNMLIVTPWHVFGLKDDWTVLSARNNDLLESLPQSNVFGWTEITAIAASDGHTIGLKADGTVVAAGCNENGECNVSDWTDIKAIAAGGTYHIELAPKGRNKYYIERSTTHSVGLKANGTVVATGYNKYGQCNVSEWEDVIAIAAGRRCSVGLKKDGTVLATGDVKSKSLEELSSWKDIIAIGTGGSSIIGLQANGKIVASGSNSYWYDACVKWEGIIEFACDEKYIMGLKADGTVLSCGNTPSHIGVMNPSEWTEIVAVSASEKSAVGLKRDGRLIISTRAYRTPREVERNRDLFNIGTWKLFNNMVLLSDRRRAIAEKAAAERKVAAELAEASRKETEAEREKKLIVLPKERDEIIKRKAELEENLPTLTGIFKTGKRRETEEELTRLKTRLSEIEIELKKIQWSTL